MPSLAETSPPLSTRMAEDLLRAWTSGDASQVEAELQRSLAIATEVEDVGEEERRHLLHAVALRMRGLPDLTRAEDPVVEVCARLLGHLVDRQ